MYKEIERLYEEAVNGNNEATEELMKRLRPLILSSIRKYYNKRELYDDLIQDGYEVILLGIKDYDKKKGVHLLGYIKMMLRFYYLDRSKKKQDAVSLNQPISSDGESIELIETLAAEILTHEDIVIMKEKVQFLWTSILELTERQREVVLLYYIEGISLREISKRLNICYRTAINIKTAGLKKLKMKMG